MKKKEKKEIKFKIWSSIIDHEDMLAWIDELNKMREDEDGEDYEEATETDVYAENNFYLDDEKSNLNLLVPGVIVYFGKLGLWDGVHTTAGKIGSNIKLIFDPICNGIEDSDYYCDKYNCRANLYHHDGTNRILFRYIARDKYKRLLEDVANGKITDEHAFMRRTKSIRPYIANVYGWTNYGKMVKIN